MLYRSGPGRYLKCTLSWRTLTSLLSPVRQDSSCDSGLVKRSFFLPVLYCRSPGNSTAEGCRFLILCFNSFLFYGTLLDRHNSRQGVFPTDILWPDKVIMMMFEISHDCSDVDNFFLQKYKLQGCLNEYAYCFATASCSCCWNTHFGGTQVSQLYCCCISYNLRSDGDCEMSHDEVFGQ